MKCVGPLRFKPVFSKILQIESEDHLSPAMDGACEHMPVVGIRKIEPIIDALRIFDSCKGRWVLVFLR